jgi:hypothetical protein
MALGHTILIIVYYVLTRKQPYQDLGTAYFDKLEHTVSNSGWCIV